MRARDWRLWLLLPLYEASPALTSAAERPGRSPFTAPLPQGDAKLHDWRSRPVLPLPLVVHLLEGRKPSLADVRGFDDFERVCKSNLAGNPDQQTITQLMTQYAVLGSSLSCRFSLDGYAPGLAGEDPSEPPPEDKPGPEQVAYVQLRKRIEQAIDDKALEPVRWVGTDGAPLFMRFPYLKLADVVTWARAQGNVPIHGFLDRVLADQEGATVAGGASGLDKHDMEILRQLNKRWPSGILLADLCEALPVSKAGKSIVGDRKVVSRRVHALEAAKLVVWPPRKGPTITEAGRILMKPARR